MSLQTRQHPELLLPLQASPPALSMEEGATSDEGQAREGPDVKVAIHEEPRPRHCTENQEEPGKWLFAMRTEEEGTEAGARASRCLRKRCTQGKGIGEDPTMGPGGTAEECLDEDVVPQPSPVHSVSHHMLRYLSLAVIVIGWFLLTTTEAKIRAVMVALTFSFIEFHFRALTHKSCRELQRRHPTRAERDVRKAMGLSTGPNDTKPIGTLMVFVPTEGACWLEETHHARRAQAGEVGSWCFGPECRLRTSWPTATPRGSSSGPMYSMARS